MQLYCTAGEGAEYLVMSHATAKQQNVWISSLIYHEVSVC